MADTNNQAEGKKKIKRTFSQKLTRYIKRAVYFLKRGIWRYDFHTLVQSKKQPWFVRAVRVVVYTIKGVAAHETFVNAAAMTFFSIIAIFPIGGLVYAVLRQVGFETMLTEQLFMRYPDYGQFISMLMEATDGMLSSTRGPWFMIVVIFFICWVSVRLFSNIERAFNRIWEVKKNRPFARKFASYMISVILIPVSVLFFMMLARVTRSFVSSYIPLPGDLVFGLITFGLLWLLFAVLFKYIPYTKVKFKSAMLASLLTVIAFMVFQEFYVSIQKGVNAYNIVYGSLAAIPLFLLWVQTSWIILLMGAEVSFSLQNISSYMQDRNSNTLSVDNRRKIILATMLAIAKHYTKNDVMVSSDDVAHELRLPVRIIRDSIYKLQSAGLVLSVKSKESDKINMYIPAKDVHNLTVYGVLLAVEEAGSSIDTRSPIKEIQEVSRLMDGIKLDAIHSHSNIKIIDIISDEYNGNR